MNTHNRNAVEFSFLSNVFFITHLQGMFPQIQSRDVLQPRYRRRPGRIITPLQPGDRSGSSCGLPAPLRWSLMGQFSGKETRLVLVSRCLETQYTLWMLTHSNLEITKNPNQ